MVHIIIKSETIYTLETFQLVFSKALDYTQKHVNIS